MNGAFPAFELKIFELMSDSCHGLTIVHQVNGNDFGLRSFRYMQRGN